MSINQYMQMSVADPAALTKRALDSIEKYINTLQNETRDWAERCEAGVAAMTLLQEMSINIRPDIPESEQIILIKVFGQVLKNISKCMRGETSDLSKELAGIRLIRKLIL